MQTKIKREKRYRRHRRVRAKISGTNEMPRICVFRSARHIYAQIIDDEKEKTLAAASDQEIKLKGKKSKTDIAKEVGKLIAEKALKKKIKKAVFDKASYRYQGKIKALAEGAREGGLIF